MIEKNLSDTKFKFQYSDR